MLGCMYKLSVEKGPAGGERRAFQRVESQSATMGAEASVRYERRKTSNSEAAVESGLVGESGEEGGAEQSLQRTICRETK